MLKYIILFASYLEINQNNYCEFLTFFFFISITFVKKLEENNQESESSHLQKLKNLKEDFGERLLKSQSDFEASVQKEKDEREKEKQKLAKELDQKEAKIAQLNAQLQGMAIPVVKFSREGYKIRKVFG